MSRLRRLVLSDRYFFITCRLLPWRRILEESEYACLARVLRERRRKHGFQLSAWVFLPDHWHALIFPRHPPTISEVMESIKVGLTLRLNARRKEAGLLWQPRFFDRAIRTVKEYHAKVEYLHLNPVRAGLVGRAEDWPWSSVHDYLDGGQRPAATSSGLKVDRASLPADPEARI